MDLPEAILIVIADTQHEDPDREISDEDIVDEVRDDIDAETVREIADDYGNRPWQLITAYALVICASDDEIAEALP